MCLAVPGKIESIRGEDFARVARVDFSGIKKEISLAYVPEANIGDYVLVHVGFAISKIDEGEAKQVFEYLAQMGQTGGTLVGSPEELKL
ncbi:MAG: HypC/HybG/HupF family hydrogenase formation chaperone [Terriglobia bacterium]|nr:HypC/HybG/HupF family hydrogenase formation chaperone [Terriglobia bacterium]